MIGSGTLAVGAGAGLILDGSIASSLAVTFQGTTGVLTIGTLAGFAPSIAGFKAGDVVVVDNVTANTIGYDTTTKGFILEDVTSGGSTIVAGEIGLAGVTLGVPLIATPYGNDTEITEGASSLPDAPIISLVNAGTVERSQTTIIAMVTAYNSNDVLFLNQTAGLFGTFVTLIEQTAGTYEVTYTAPGSIPTSTTDSVGFEIDEVDGATTVGTATALTSIPLDAGPTVTTHAPSVIEQGQSTSIGTVKPGLPGDTLTLSSSTSGGSLVWSSGNKLSFIAPSTTITTSYLVSYTVGDQYDDVTVSGEATVIVDGGPKITQETPSAVADGKTTVIGIVTPGILGDKLKLTETAGDGLLSLGTVQTNGQQQVIYTAPASIPTGTTDTVGYKISDQHNDVTVSATASVSLIGGSPPAVSADPDGIGVLDAATGLEWLPLTYTAGDPYDQVIAGNVPGIPAGYVVANSNQVLQLLHDIGLPGSVGILYGGVSVGTAVADSFQTLFGLTQNDATSTFAPFTASAGDAIYAGPTANPDGLLSFFRFDVDLIPGDTTASFDDSGPEPNDGNFTQPSATQVNEGEFMYKVSLPTLPGASLTLKNDTVTGSIQSGQTVGLDALVTAFGGSIPELIIQGPGSAAIAGSAIIPDLESARSNNPRTMREAGTSIFSCHLCRHLPRQVARTSRAMTVESDTDLERSFLGVA